MESDATTADRILNLLQQYHLSAFLAGVSLILLFIGFNLAMEVSTGLTVVGDELLTPARLALIGLGTGYYLSAALRQHNTDMVAFHLGAFLSLLSLAALSIQIQPVGWVLATAVLFSFSLGTSSLVDSYAGIRQIHEALGREISRVGLVFLVSAQYVVSFYRWSDTQLSSYSLVAQGIILVCAVGLLYIIVEGSKYLEKRHKTADGGASASD